MGDKPACGEELGGTPIPAHYSLYALYKILDCIESHMRTYCCVCICYVFSVNICTWSSDLSNFRKRCLADLNCSCAAEGSQARSLWGDLFRCSGTRHSDVLVVLMSRFSSQPGSMGA